MTLQPPTSEHLPSYLGFIEELRAHGDTVWPSMEGDVLLVHPDRTTWWGVADGLVVGRIVLRHFLTDDLRLFGGHVGYEVRPSQRGRGYATAMLRRLLQTPQARAIGPLLLTCAPANLASNKTIQANGGVLEKTAWVESCQRETNYYWISPSL